MNITVSELVKLFDLKPHPEGGYYKETYRSEKKFGNRNCSTAIYYLLPEGTKSNFHRLASDEVYHFYMGGPLTIVQISPSGQVEKITLSQDVKAGHKLQHVIPAGYWFGAFPNPGSPFSLAGCTVAPGFDFADFEMGKRTDLLKQFAHLKEIIEKLTDL